MPPAYKGSPVGKSMWNTFHEGWKVVVGCS